ncbi:LysE family translocator [Phenylobacterium sp. VNQ135]|uniref:LysE family translocator n=1 Tax=Phenylobacterium sp. VNQ135 TaxID=3400922 RepID=UPI003C0CE7A1
MLAWAQLLPFIAAALIVELTPGPNMGYLAVVAARQGRRAGLVTVAGVTAGLALCLLASIGGLVELLAARPSLLAGLRWVGVAYFLWLAVDAWRASTAAAAGEPVTDGRLFTRGLIVNLLNPKALLLYVALLPGFLEAGRGRVEVQALLLGLIHIAIAVAVHLGIVLGAVRVRDGLTGAGAGAPAWLQPAAAVLLVGVAAWLALSAL